MADRSILFSGPMIRAIRAGIKTQTRRLATNRSAGRLEPGDVLRVRESLRRGAGDVVTYVSDGAVAREAGEPAQWRWRRGSIPSIHMPNWAVRDRLLCTAKRVEPLQALTLADASAEGIPSTWDEALPIFGEALLGVRPAAEWNAATPVENYAWLWDRLNGAGSWSRNPSVIVIEFRRLGHATNCGG